MATITLEVTPEQWNRWRTAAGAKPDLRAYLARAGDFYAARLQARLELARRTRTEGRL